ncbi:MAG: P-loop NTPase [Candidatus Margulisiibacteriota bacterium]
MNKIKIIKNELGEIFHHKKNTYLNDSSILSNVIESNGNVKCTFIEPAGSQSIKELKSTIESKLFELNWVKTVEIGIELKTKPSRHEEKFDHIQNIIAISSCKGGVGKSTISLNLATALSMNGAQVGIFDADIHGPSLPTLIKPSSIATTLDEDKLPPFINNNIKLMSYGYIQKQANQPAILRGPIASNLLKQLLFKTDWGYLDYLIIDCPPGTGDILLTITQDIQLDGAIIVTSPHELAYVDVQKGVEMFQKVNVPILSLIENMSYFLCENCDQKHYLYGSGRLQKFCMKNNIKLWYDLPFNKALGNFNDNSAPYLLTCDNDDDSKKKFERIAADTAWEIYSIESEADVLITEDNTNKILTLQLSEITSKINYSDLRHLCECAYCVDETTRTKIFKIESIDPDIKINKTYTVGHYGIGIEWLEHGNSHASMYSKEELIKKFK